MFANVSTQQITCAVVNGIQSLRYAILPMFLWWMGLSAVCAQAPVVSNVVAQQRSGTKLVDITYDVTAVTPTVNISLRISNDGGASYNIPATTLSGAVGDHLTTGTGKVITWNAGVDWNGNYNKDMRFEVNAVIPAELALIPAGAFQMGVTSGDTDSNAPSVSVTVSAFYIGKNEVTKALWDEVRTWAVANGYTDLATGAGKASNHPVQTVSWWDVIKWCNARSQKEGLTPCYTVGGSVMKTGTTPPTVNWTADGYRLPTEAEWEKAARGGVNGKRFPWGTDTISHSQANYLSSTSYSYDASGSVNNYHPTYNDGTTLYTSPVGSFAANGYGLNDMAGNVMEWCWDWYGASTYENGSTDPRGAASGTSRVGRGGSWKLHGALGCRAAYRVHGTPTTRENSLGFRVARSLLHQTYVAASGSTAVDTRIVDARFVLTITPTNNGGVSVAGPYLGQSDAILTATPIPGYLFNSWSEDLTGSQNPATLLMDKDKTVVASFVEDTRDPDKDGLSNWAEIVNYRSDPDNSDTDNDGIRDGIEVTQEFNPLLADTNSNGLSDTYELLYQGNTDPFTPRVGDRMRYDINRLGYQGTYKLVGTLPAGLSFNAITGILEGKLTGSAKISNLTIQVLNGKTVVRSIPLSIPVLAFPASLAGTWQVLLENDQGQPEGLMTVVVTSPGNWSASYDEIGTRMIRKVKGAFDLKASEEQASWNITFPAGKSFPSATMSFGIDGNTALADGTHARGNMRGFRLARGAEWPRATQPITLLIDQGAQDGYRRPAGMGWATGTLNNRGVVSLKGQLGDAQAFTTSLQLGATGQALMWLKPYKNLNSFIGGIVSLHGSGALPPSSLHQQESGLMWNRVADAKELSYPGGFGPMAASVEVRNHTVPANSVILSQNLGLTGQVIGSVVFEGGGLPDPNAVVRLPQSFAIDASYKLISLPIPGQSMSPWSGAINARSGGLTGTLGVVASNNDILSGNATVSGVLLPKAGSGFVGGGLVKIPIAGPKGSFRTGAIILGAEEKN